MEISESLFFVPDDDLLCPPCLSYGGMVQGGRGRYPQAGRGGGAPPGRPGDQMTSWLWTAYRMSSALVFMFIFRRTRARYVLTVFTLRDNSPAISETDLPEAIRDITWYSRSERPSWSGRS